MKKLTKKAIAAKAYLEKLGYKVLPPPCPSCRGYGFINKGYSFPNGGGISSYPCPNGCPSPQIMYTNQISEGQPKLQWFDHWNRKD